MAIAYIMFIHNFIKDEIESFSNAEAYNDDDDNSKEDSMVKQDSICSMDSDKMQEVDSKILVL